DLIVEYGNHSAASGVAATHRLMDRKPKPTAIVAGNDLMAIGALEALATLGIRVPQDVSVVGNDDIFVAGFGRIDLTTIRQPKRDLGVRSAEILLERIENRHIARKMIKVAPSLVVRGSTSYVR